jgi:hypothetical protein
VIRPWFELSASKRFVSPMDFPSTLAHLVGLIGVTVRVEVG